MALVCVSIAGAVMYGIVHLAVQSHREVDLQQRRTQARWILESAVDRTAALLAANHQYQGERWTIEASELGGRHCAEVTIVVEKTKEHTNWRQVRIVADYPAELPFRVRQSRLFVIQIRP